MLRIMMCAARMSGTRRIIATKGSGIIFALRQNHHLPVGGKHRSILKLGTQTSRLQRMQQKKDRSFDLSPL